MCYSVVMFEKNPFESLPFIVLDLQIPRFHTFSSLEP